MWDKGTLEIDGTKVDYWVKHYEKGSEFGIDEGRISKLDCRLDGERILNYDRGWDLEPQTELATKALEILKSRFN